MKITQICALVLLVVVGSAVAFADGIHDPKVIVHGVTGDLPLHCGPNGCQGVGLNFSFTIPAVDIFLAVRTPTLFLVGHACCEQQSTH